MALDIKRTVLTTYTADASDHIEATKRLASSAKATAKEIVDAFGSMDGGFQKLKHGMQEFAHLAEGAWKSFEFSVSKARKEAAVGFIDMDKLRAATKGLATDMEILTNATARNSGAQKLTTKEHVIAEKAIRALAAGGTDLAQATEQVNKTIRTLKGEGLEELGHKLTLTENKLETAADKTKRFQEIMSELTRIGKQAGESQHAFGHQAETAAVQLRNAWDGLKDGMGKLVEASGPLLVALAKMLTMSIDIATTASKGAYGGQNLDVLKKELQEVIANAETQKKMGEFDVGTGRASQVTKKAQIPKRINKQIIYVDATDEDRKQMEEEVNQIREAEKAAREKAAEAWKKKMEDLRKFTEAATDAILKNLENAVAGGLPDFGSGLMTGPRSLGQAGRGVAVDRGYDTIASDLDHDIGKGTTEYWLTPDGIIEKSKVDVPIFPKGMGPGSNLDEAVKFDAEVDAGMRSFYGKGGEFTQRKRRNFLEDMFGSPSEFAVYRQLFAGLTQAVGSAYGAWIDGSMSASQAFKKGIADMLKTTAIQALVEALKMTALGIGYLATGSPKAAPAFMSAAKWGAVAVAAGAAAKMLGGGGASGAGGGGGGTGAGAAAPPRGNDNREEKGSHRVIVIGDPHGDRTPRERAKDFRRQANRALGTGWSYEG